MLWLVGTQLHQDNADVQKLWDMWKEALNITFRVVADLYVP